MIATIILAVGIFSGVGYIIYTRFIKRSHAAGCHNCDDLGCPLVDPIKLKQQTHLKK